MNFKRGIPITFVLLALAGFIWFGPKTHETPIVVKGNPSAKDLAEIKALARQEQWNSILRDHSWPNIRALPGNLLYYFQSRVQSVVFDPSINRAWVRIGKSEMPSELYSMGKETNGWGPASLWPD